MRPTERFPARKRNGLLHLPLLGSDATSICCCRATVIPAIVFACVISFTPPLITILSVLHSEREFKISCECDYAYRPVANLPATLQNFPRGPEVG